jgi:WD40 repeat protein
MKGLELPLIPKAQTLAIHQSLNTERALEPEEHENLQKFSSIVSEIEDYLSSHKEVITVMPYPVCSFNLISDSNTLIYGSSNGNIAKFNISERALVMDLAIGSKQLNSLILTPDSRYILTPASVVVKVFNAETLMPVAEIKYNKSVVNKIILSRCGNWLYLANKFGRLVKFAMEGFKMEQVMLDLGSEICDIGISDDGKIFYVLTLDSVLRLYDYETFTEIKNFEQQSNLHLVVAISPNSSLLATCYKDFTINIWDLKTFKVTKTLKGHTDTIRCMKFSSNSQFLISGSADCSIRVWPLNLNSEPVILSGHSGPITTLQISPDSQYIYSASEDSTFRQWVFPDFSHYTELSSHYKLVRRLIITQDEKYLISVSSDGVVKMWDVELNKFFMQLANLKRDITRLETTRDGRKLILSTVDGNVHMIDLTTYNLEKKITAAKGAIRVLKLNPRGDSLIIGSTESRIGVWSFPEMEFKFFLRGHKKCVWGGAFSVDGRYLYTGSEDRCIKIWNMDTQECIDTFKKHQNSIFFLAVTKTNDVLISGDTGGVIIVWNIRERYAENIIKRHPLWITNLYISSDDSYFISADESGLMCFWDLKTRQCITSYQSSSNIWYYTLDRSESYIYYSKKDEMVVSRYPNPMVNTDITLFGPDNSSSQFLGYLYRLLVEKSITDHDNSMNEYVIMPYKINLTHLYAYLGLVDHIGSYMKNKFSMIPTQDGETVLSILTNRGANKGIDSILDKLGSEIPNNPALATVLEPIISTLNHIGSPQLPYLYKSLIRISTDESLPNHCSGQYKYPIYHASDSTKLISTSFFPKEAQAIEGDPIIFKESFLKIDFSIGSNQSLDFLNSLISCPDEDIFKSPFITSILTYKWENVKLYMLIQALVYLLYMIALCLYTLNLFNRTAQLIIIFILNILMTIFEVFQISVSGRRYWREMWNYFDLVTDFTCLFYSGCLLFYGDLTYLKKVFEIITLTSWMRGISYFRIFKQTRYMINLLTEVIKDMLSFMVLLIYSLLGFSFLFLVTKGGEALLDNVYVSYKLSLGDVPDPTIPTDLYQFVVITAAVVMNPVIMLNLLISIIGDTYNRVQSSTAVADMKELCEMIIEMELLAFWRRETSYKKYLQICVSKDIEEETAPTTEESFALLDAKLNQLQLSVNESITSNMQILNEFRDFKTSTDSKLQSLEILLKMLADPPKPET